MQVQIHQNQFDGDNKVIAEFELDDDNTGTLFFGVAGPKPEYLNLRDGVLRVYFGYRDQVVVTPDDSGDGDQWVGRSI